MSIKGKLLIVSVSAALAFYAIVGGFLSVQKDVFAKGDPYVQLRIFGDVLRHIVRDYVDEPDLEKVRIGALRGLAEGLDPYSAYLSPEQAKKFQASRPDQTGLVLSKVVGYIYVVSVVKGSPADKAGLRSGDFIEYIGSLPTRDISLYDAEELIAGAAGSDLQIKVFRRGRPYKATIKRGSVDTPAIEASLLEPGIGYVKVTSLAEGKSEEIKKQILDLQKKGAQKLVFDLRGASTGRIQTGVDVANLFIKSGTLAKTIGHNGTVAGTFDADASKAVFNGPVVFIADKSTASAGEVIAAAAVANKRGELVGERTFGAGTEQKLFELKGGAALLLTTIKYADPAGTPFLKETPGVAPTVEVKASAAPEEVLPEDNDQQQNPEDQTADQVDQVLPIEAAPADDVQLKKALELLKGTQDKRAAGSDGGTTTTAASSIEVPGRQRVSRAGARL